MIERDLIKLVSRVWPSELFKNVSPFGQFPNYGFCINNVTIRFKWEPDTMEVWYFHPETGKRSDAMFLTPTSKIELLSRLRHHCGDKIINDQLINFKKETINPHATK